MFYSGFYTVSAVAADRAPVSVAKAVNAPLVEEVPLTGTVTSARIATLSAGVGGLVDVMYVDVGARVELGTPLIKLDTELAEIALSGAEASLGSAEAALNEAQRRVDEAQPLVKQNGIAASEMRTREAQMLIARALVDRARSDVNQRAAELGRHEVKAPFAGVISRKLTETGEWISPGSEVMELVSTENLRLDFQVPQIYYPRINPQAKIFVRFDATPDQLLEARIISRVPVSNPKDRTFLLRAELLEANPGITSGMSTHGVLQLQSAEAGISVPRDALLRYADGRIVVWVVDQSGDAPTVVERPVSLGLSSGGVVEITQGLNSGELVVTRGNEALQPGQLINIVNP